MAKKTLNGYIDTVGDYYKKLPVMPKGGRDFFVKILPWFALIIGILGIWGVISSFGISSSFIPQAYAVGVNSGLFMVTLVLGLVSSVLLIMAFNPLKKGLERGWMLVYYSIVVGLISNILVFALGGVILNLIGFYILYSIRSHYK